MPGRPKLALRDVGEHAWLERLVRRLRVRGGRVLVGPGDDAAVLRPERRPLLFTTDALVEGVHFRRAWAPPEVLGRRAFGVNASDLAAMGGVPTAALLALEVPRATPVAWLDALAAGVAGAASRAGARLVGGNLSAGPHVAITVALVGTAPGRVVGRRGARVGDQVYVTGTLGGAGCAVRALQAGRPARLPVPPLRIRAGILLARHARAMIDVSDGLVQDLGHLCRASGVAAIVELGRIPIAAACRRALGREAARFAATAGEDYELVAVGSPRTAGALARLAPRLGCRLTRIGHIVGGPPAVRVVGVDGRRIVVRTPAGFDHFR